MSDKTDPAAAPSTAQDIGTDYDAIWNYEAALDNLRGVNDALRQDIATLQRELAEARAERDQWRDYFHQAHARRGEWLAACPVCRGLARDKRA